MKLLISSLALLIVTGTGTAFAQAALCNEVKDRVKRDQCHCQAEFGAKIERAPNGGIRWGGTPAKFAPQKSECMRKRGHNA